MYLRAHAADPLARSHPVEMDINALGADGMISGLKFCLINAR